VSRPIILCAGGTGGHLFPAESLAIELQKRGFKTILITDERAGHFASKTFAAQDVYQIPAATPSNGSLFAKFKAVWVLFKGTRRARRLMRELKPAAVIGFGGYPTVPPVLAASMLGFKTFLHEQNGVMGRANVFLSSRVDAIATGFPDVRKIPESARDKQVYVGNPVRPHVVEAASIPYTPFEKDGLFHLLVFGGSQGARVFSDCMPAAIALLPLDIRNRIRLTQQARGEDQARVQKAYADIEFPAQVEAFFHDLPQRLAQSHLVISRSGASTVAELAAIGRPSILVPLPGALDQDQAANAKILADVGAAWIIPQPDFTPETVSKLILSHFETPSRLTEAALSAKSVGCLDAASRLADVVLKSANSE
jgi:UDP-N-acetylglucosamine--N-acetylmuramyl-(pentapeptide) pyrophosphoryl-undecaprenol N-acetylglucosamine transferase